MHLYGEIIIDHTGAQTMFFLTCTMISSVYLAHYGVSRAKDWVSVDSGTEFVHFRNEVTVFIFNLKMYENSY